MALRRIDLPKHEMHFPANFHQVGIMISRRLRSYQLMIMLCCLLTFLTGANVLKAQQGGLPPPQSGQQGVKTEGPSTGRSAQGKAVEGEPLLKLYTEVVTLDVTVTDKRHRPVTGLESQHFEIYEDEVMQKIEFFSNLDAPASVGIVFDISESMRTKIDRARAALKAFIETC